MPQTGSARSAALRAVAFGALLVALVVAAQRLGAPDPETIRASVEEAGRWGPAFFLAGYALWSLLPVPKNVATAAAGALFGVGAGAALAWAGALIGSAAAFAIARSLGRDGVARLLRGRLEAADGALGDRGFGAVLLARLVPIVPFTALNYSAGVTAVGTRHYLSATALGMIPGTLAYAALGASAGTDPRLTAAALAALVLLSVGGWWAARRTRRLRSATSTPEPTRD